MSTFRIPASQFRSLPDPAGGQGKVGLFYADVRGIPPELNEWRDVNPREVKQTTSVYKSMWQTLTEEPEHFAERNRGLTITAADVSYDEKRHDVVLTFDDKASHGVIDGGHTLHAILRGQEYKSEEEWPAKVFVKVITGAAPDQIAEIAGGLNNSQQVDLKSLENLKEHFGALQTVLAGEPYAELIAYKMNEVKPIDVREILYYLAVFDAGTYTNERHPAALFGRKEGIVRDFAKEAKDGFRGSFGILITKAPEILRLRDAIEKSALNEKVGRYAASKRARVKSPKHVKNPLHFMNEEVNGRIPLGWLMPLLGGFRANVEWNVPSGTFSWKVPNDTLLPSCIEGLVAGVKEIHEREGSRPEYVGRSATAWRMCYERVQRAILEHQLAAAVRGGAESSR